MSQPRSNNPGERAALVGDGGCGFSWTLAAGLAFITFNSGMSVYLSWDDVAVVTFAVTSYLDLLLLLCCLWLYERAAAGSAWRERLKASVWTLTTLLTFAFAYMVVGTAGRLTLPVALLVWVTAAATGIGAFTTFFDRRGRIALLLPLDETMVLPPV